VAVGLLLLNGFAFHILVEPWLEEHLDRRMEEDTLRGRLPLFSVVGPLSIVSWYTALIIGASDGLGQPLWLYLLVYGALLGGGMTTAYLVLSHMVGAPGEKEEVEEGGFPWTVALLAVLVLLFAGALGMAARSV
jgi:hypothetical protein